MLQKKIVRYAEAYGKKMRHIRDDDTSGTLVTFDCANASASPLRENCLHAGKIIA
jgi:hypothetical protein